MPSELVSIKIRKQLVDSLKKLKSELHFRSISDVVQFLLEYHQKTRSIFNVEILLSQVKDLLSEIEGLLKKERITTKIPPKSGTEVVSTTKIPPKEEPITTQLPPSGLQEEEVAQKEGIGPKEEKVAQFSLYDYCVNDSALRPKLEQVAREALEYGYDYEVLKIQSNIYALILGPRISALFRIQDKVFRLKDVMKRTLWIRRGDFLVLAFRAPRTIHIDVFQFGKKIATLRAPF